MTPIHKNVVGLGIHQKQIVACGIIVVQGGKTRHELKELGTFRRKNQGLVAFQINGTINFVSL
jgi:hypothetical protein